MSLYLLSITTQRVQWLRQLFARVYRVLDRSTFGKLSKTVGSYRPALLEPLYPGFSTMYNYTLILTLDISLLAHIYDSRKIAQTTHRTAATTEALTSYYNPGPLPVSILTLTPTLANAFPTSSTTPSLLAFKASSK